MFKKYKSFIQGLSHPDAITLGVYSANQNGDEGKTCGSLGGLAVVITFITTSSYTRDSIYINIFLFIEFNEVNLAIAPAVMAGLRKNLCISSPMLSRRCQKSKFFPNFIYIHISLSIYLIISLYDSGQQKMLKEETGLVIVLLPGSPAWSPLPLVTPEAAIIFSLL